MRMAVVFDGTVVNIIEPGSDWALPAGHKRHEDPAGLAVIGEPWPPELLKAGHFNAIEAKCRLRYDDAKRAAMNKSLVYFVQRNAAESVRLTDGQRETAIGWLAIRDDYCEGLVPVRQIARRHGVSDMAIRNRAKRHGWTRARPVRPGRSDGMRRNIYLPLVHEMSLYFELGEPLDMCAPPELQCSHAELQRAVDTLGYVPNLSAEDRSVLVLFGEGLDQARIAEMTKLSEQRVGMMIWAWVNAPSSEIKLALERRLTALERQIAPPRPQEKPPNRPSCSYELRTSDDAVTAPGVTRFLEIIYDAMSELARPNRKSTFTRYAEMVGFHKTPKAFKSLAHLATWQGDSRGGSSARAAYILATTTAWRR